MMRRLYAHDRLPYDRAAARRALSGLLADAGRGRAYVIEVRRRPAGYAVLTLGWSLEYRGRDAFVDEIYLEPGARGRGVGRRALAFLFATCGRLGVRALHLEVERRNHRARRFYRRNGFADHDRVLMTRSIS